MSGHSKWSQIKRKKGIKDEQKGRMFSKLSRLITLAVKEGGGIVDPEKNVKLRLAVEKAKNYNLPKENIQRAIEKAKNPENLELKEVIYEGFAPGGVSLIILTTTDNPNRTLSEVRKILEQGGGKLGSPGVTSFLFDKCGLAVFDKNLTSEKEILDFAEKIEALDIEEEEDLFFLYVPFEKIGQVKKSLGEIKARSIEIDYHPRSLVGVKDQKTAQKILSLVEALEEHSDVHKVWANFDIPDKFLNEK
jgi:YebC/PmpR family DNA-binding regulatory protein